MGRCKTCHRPRTGHVGPLGNNCTMDPLDIPGDGSSSEEERSVHDEDGVFRARVDSGRAGIGAGIGGLVDNDSMMTEMMRQLSMLSTDVQ